MQWHDGNKINTSSGTPRSDQGPTIAVNDITNMMYMAYIGKGGQNLYVSTCSTAGGSFGSWEGNKQIKSAGGHVPLSRERPAVEIFPNPYEPFQGDVVFPYIVYPDHRTGMLMEMAQSSAGWSNPIAVSGFQGLQSGAWHQPLLLNPMGFNLFLVALDDNGTPWYSGRTYVLDGYSDTAGAGPWSTAQPVPRSREEYEETGIRYWALSHFWDATTSSGWMVLAGFAEYGIFLYGLRQVLNDRFVPMASQAWEYLGQVTIALPPTVLPGGSETLNYVLTNPWGAVVSTASNTLQFIFTKKSERSLWYQTVDMQTRAMGPLLPIPGPGNFFETAAPPAAEFIETPVPTVCLAYKGASTEDLYFAYGS
jgi:hypothetical protein